MNERATLAPHKFDQVERDDRFEEISQRIRHSIELEGGYCQIDGDDCLWLIAEVSRQRARAEKAEGEVERLRRIEAAAQSLNNCIWEFGEDAPGACGEYAEYLDNVLEASRPREGETR